MRSLLVVYAKGFSMGAADVVPGVSGGTIALILGIYDRLITAITAIDPRELRSVTRLHEPEGRAELAAAVERMDAVFLVALGLGVISAVAALSGAMHHAAVEHPVPTYGFFFGLIAASGVVLYRGIDVVTPGRLAIAVAGIAIAAAVTGETTGGAPHTAPVVFLAGAVAICAMVLPGVSGAFFLVVLGQYEYLTGTLSAFLDGLLDLAAGGPVAPLVESSRVVVVFGLGAAVGLFTMAHVVRRALDRRRAATLTFLVSLMVGGLRLPAARVASNLGDAPTTGLPIAVLAGVVGAGAVILVDRYTDDLDYSADDLEHATDR